MGMAIQDRADGGNARQQKAAAFSALSVTKPMAQHSKVFVLLFVHKKKSSPSLF
jgi:hypothetical protein